MGKIKFFMLFFVFSSCGYYNFTGTNAIEGKTFQVNFFKNTSSLIEPGVDLKFTQTLQNLIQNQTNLNLVGNNGDLLYEGEIIDYRISPMSATADQRAAQNRLTITVFLRFTNKKKESDNFEKKYNFYYDYGADEILSGNLMNTALNTIFERISQDIFNDSLARW